MEKKYKVITFFLVILIILSVVYINFFNDRPADFSNDNISKKEELQSGVTPLPGGGGPGRVPWKELNDRWLEELKKFLVLNDSAKGIEKFNEYIKVREKSFKEMDYNGLKMQRLYSQNPVNAILEKKLSDESSEIVKRYGDKTRSIFGEDYLKVKQLYKDYEKSIQSYSLGGPLSVDFGFED